MIAFGVIEYKAIKDDGEEEGDFTLSHFVRRLADKRFVFRAAVAGLLIWLGPMDHFNLF